MRDKRIVAAAGLAALGLALAGVGSTRAAYTDQAGADVAPVVAHLPAMPVAVAMANLLDTNQVLVDGTLWMWGFYGDGPNNPGGGPLGARGLGSTTNNAPNPFPALADVVSVAGNAYAYKAITSDGSLWTWGLDGYGLHAGQTGRIAPLSSPVATWVPLDRDVVQVVGGEYHSAWLKSDGTVWASGNNAYGQRGDGTALTPLGTASRPNQVKFPEGAAPIVALGGVYEGTYAVDADGRVFYWGRNHRGGAGFTSEGEYVRNATEVVSLTAIVQAEGLRTIGGGYAWGALLTEAGNVHTWGFAENNASGHHPGNWTAAAGKDLYEPKLLVGDVTMLSTSFESARVLRPDGTVWAWGSVLWGGPPMRSATGESLGDNSLQMVYDGSDGDAVAVAGNKDSGTWFLADGSMWTWGENGAGAACGGLTFGNCPNANNTLYVWPAYRVPGIGE